MAACSSPRPAVEALESRLLLAVNPLSTSVQDVPVIVVPQTSSYTLTLSDPGITNAVPVVVMDGAIANAVPVVIQTASTQASQPIPASQGTASPSVVDGAITNTVPVVIQTTSTPGSEPVPASQGTASPSVSDGAITTPSRRDPDDFDFRRAVTKSIAATSDADAPAVHHDWSRFPWNPAPLLSRRTD